MGWPNNMRVPKCDVCGRFVPLDDLSSGDASHTIICPDSDWTRETDETLCRMHNTPEQRMFVGKEM